jgi:hypothetical protein
MSTFVTAATEAELWKNRLQGHAFFLIKPPLVLFFTLNLTSQAMFLMCNPKAKYL